jgi:hypothetical protein
MEEGQGLDAMKQLARRTSLAVVLLLASVGTASAESTAEMLSSCKSLSEAAVTGDRVTVTKDFPSGMCWGAFAVVQRVIATTYRSGQTVFTVGVCAPTESKRTQLIAVFVDYARRNPQRLHEDFFAVATDALTVAFPCQSR